VRTPPARNLTRMSAALLVTYTSITLPAGTTEVQSGRSDQRLTLIRTPPEILTRQKLPNFVGISAQTSGALGLSMNLVVIPPGAAAQPHAHMGFESAVYVLEGRVETRYGPGLKSSVVTEAEISYSYRPMCPTNRSTSARPRRPGPLSSETIPPNRNTPSSMTRGPTSESGFLPQISARSSWLRIRERRVCTNGQTA